MKAKYLHIEVIDGDLYVYQDEKIRGGRVVSKADMDYECWMGQAKEPKHLVVKLSPSKRAKG